MSGTGTASLTFPTFPLGNQTTTTTVTGVTGILSGSQVEAYMMGDTTSDHNAYEHSMVPIFLVCGNIVAGTGFDIVATCDWILHGVFTVHYVWV